MAATQQSNGRGRRGGMIVGINVTPMVDVVLVLLVIMMVSATYIVSQSIRVDLPRTASSDESVASTAQVTVTRAGAAFFNGEAVTEAQLVERFRRAGENPDLSLVITADREASHGSVMHVLDLAKVANIVHFAINVERSP